MLATGYYAFYDLHRPTYHAYAAAHLSPEEAQIATTTGQDPAAVTTLLAAGDRSDPAPGQRPRVRLQTDAAPGGSLEARWRAALRLRTAQALPTS
ncbi:hypothetical protein CLM85_03770 [Streptomyces albidoflavus]|nr:hypothetical protein CLM81_02245 [Streptomyces albidoflavus]PAX89166.1 hypothetical protein CLM82_22615 [Streptomyces albidoflavus]PBO18306.1 hypothetical protein CLM83_13035 [Streptomyces albidoflavus]PBO25524.1 hypothetical protein CLM85_03770 [Streptomyces albidoflavus]PBO27631.1 hypothetical protein CLM84_24640 [Streptomyces albidoflavus]